MRKPLEIGKGKYDVVVTAFVNAYWKTQCRPPSIREIMDACGINSTSVTRYTLRRLAKSGKYELRNGDSRGIVPVWVKAAIQSASA